jgi:hypothetical protein
MQRAFRFRNIVDIDRIARHMLMRGIMPLIGGDTTFDSGGFDRACRMFVHACLLQTASIC